MTLQQRQQAFVQLGLFIKRHFLDDWELKEERFHIDLNKLVDVAYTYNGWFTEDNVKRALLGISSMLNEKDLDLFSSVINNQKLSEKTVAIIMAGNIPAVGFHDLLCVLLSGHKALIKVSSDDPALITFLAGMLIYYEKDFAPRILFSDGKLSNFEAVIATGSNNSSNYFNYYFSKYPNIIRKNRTSIAILNGKETISELEELGKDIFYYYGLGCRNVCKLFVPKGYNFDTFFESIFKYNYVIDNKKYNNNYEYNRAVYLLDLIPFLDNNFLIIKESKDLHAPTAVLYYNTYDNETQLVENINEVQNELQCIVSNFRIEGVKTIAFGQTQNPTIFDFADNVNTLDFLNKI